MNKEFNELKQQLDKFIKNKGEEMNNMTQTMDVKEIIEEQEIVPVEEVKVETCQMVKDVSMTEEEAMDTFLEKENDTKLGLVDELSVDILKAFSEGTCRISISAVRKQFSVGYTRAKRIIDNLEEMNLISQSEDGNRLLLLENLKEIECMAA